MRVNFFGPDPAYHEARRRHLVINASGFICRMLLVNPVTMSRYQTVNKVPYSPREIPRLCRGGSRSLTFPAVRAPQLAGRRGNALRGRASEKGSTFHEWRSAFNIEIGPLEVSGFPLINRDVRRQAPLRGPIPKAPGFAGGYLLHVTQANSNRIRRSKNPRGELVGQVDGPKIGSSRHHLVSYIRASMSCGRFAWVVGMGLATTPNTPPLWASRRSPSQGG